MSAEIIGLHDWFQTPPGRFLLAWEQARFDLAVADVFGFNALQLGLPEIDGLRANRMPHRWLATATPHERSTFLTDPVALPFPANSLDLVLLPHTLEFSIDPHAALREAQRVLVPEGKVVLCGLNPNSLWGWRQRRAQLYQRLGFGELFLPKVRESISHGRLRDWLRLLSFELESSTFGIYRPAVRSQTWLDRTRWLDAVGERSWPILGAAYFVVATKRVHGMTLLSSDWKRKPALAAAPVSVAGRVHCQAPKHVASPSIHLKEEQFVD